MAQRERADRRWAGGALLAGLVVLLVACGGADDAAPAPSTAVIETIPPGVVELDRACGAAAALMYRDAAAGDRPAVEGLAPEQIRGFLRDLAGQAQGDAGDDIAVVSEATEAFAESGTVYSDEVRAAFDRVVAWAAGVCPPSKPVWACISPTTAADAGGDQRFPSAEAAVEGEPVDVGSRRALSQDPTAVVFGWVDDHDLVRHRVTVLSEADGWRRHQVTRCPGVEAGTD